MVDERAGVDVESAGGIDGEAGPVEESQEPGDRVLGFEILHFNGRRRGVYPLDPGFETLRGVEVPGGIDGEAGIVDVKPSFPSKKLVSQRPDWSNSNSLVIPPAPS